MFSPNNSLAQDDFTFYPTYVNASAQPVPPKNRSEFTTNARILLDAYANCWNSTQSKPFQLLYSFLCCSKKIMVKIV